MDTARPGLRERKKARTRAAIQEHALRLFKAQGYAETTIEQIADAADVSQSTFFRYFPTKEDVVLHDELDPRLIASLREQPPELSPVEAVRRRDARRLHAAHAGADGGRGGAPAARSRGPRAARPALDQYLTGLDMLTEAFAERLGKPTDSVPIRALAGAIIGVGLAAILADDTDRMDEYFAYLAESFKG